MNPSEIAKALGSLGGKKTFKKHGKKHYQKLAEHMNKVRAEKKTKALKKKDLNMGFSTE